MYDSLRPLLFKIDPEMAHEMTHGALQVAQALPFASQYFTSLFSFESSRLKQKVWDIDFANPVGLAAGFDKNAKVADGMAMLGFGFLELGSVSKNSCSGNERPRLFRLPEDQALINRMGLNNLGPYRFLENLQKSRSRIPKIVNISKTNDPTLNGLEAIADILECYKIVGALASIVVFNLSCPNTKDGKTFEEVKSLETLINAVIDVKKSENFSHPVLLKFSSDVHLDDLRMFLDIAIDKGVNGFVLSNTSNSRDGLRHAKGEIEKIGRGGLSGTPIFDRSLERVSVAYSHTKGVVPIVAVGGIDSKEKALKMIKSGASLIEIYTGLVYKGPSLVKHILEGIEQELSRLGCVSITEIVGSENKH